MSTYKLHPLHSIEYITQQLKVNGEFDPLRCTGRSTAQALRILATAIEDPGKSVPVRDHHSSPQSDRHLADMVRVLADQMGLQHIHTKVLRPAEPSIVFERRELPNQGRHSPVSPQEAPTALGLCDDLDMVKAIMRKHGYSVLRITRSGSLAALRS